MFSCLIVALFALLSLSVSSRPIHHHSVSSTGSSSPNATSVVPFSLAPSISPSSTTADDCSDPIPSTPLPQTSSAAPTTPGPTSVTPTTSVASTPATPSAPASTSPVLTTVSDATSGTYTGGYATYFYQNGNPGACGEVNSDSAYICAMDQTRFGTAGPASPLCGQQVMITNTNTGQSITVTIADDCPTCSNENSIDLSVGAFSALAPLSQGIFPIQWSYV